jgi:hypothetical protein
MNFKHLFVFAPELLLVLGSAAANAGKVVEDANVLVCVTDKWDEKEQEKNHKPVDYADRRVAIRKFAAFPVGKSDAGQYQYE